MTTDTDDHPYRVADHYGEGWIRNGPNATYTTHPCTKLGNWTYEQIETERGPLRPVVPMGDDERAQLVHALVQAGVKATASLLVALHRTVVKLLETNGSAAAVTAGRPGSWEAELLRHHVVWEGESIKSARLDETAVDVAQGLLERWTTGPTQVELAEGLLYVLIEASEQAGGWNKIADQWVRARPHVNQWTYGRLHHHFG